jgi:hypothetical protein
LAVSSSLHIHGKASVLSLLIGCYYDHSSSALIASPTHQLPGTQVHKLDKSLFWLLVKIEVKLENK